MPEWWFSPVVPGRVYTVLLTILVIEQSHMKWKSFGTISASVNTALLNLA